MAGDDSIRIRPATAADAEPLARGVIEGVENYPSFAPPGWTAPSFQDELKAVRAALADPDVSCLVAESGSELVAQITLLPALETAKARGFTELRLFVAAGQARARRFYEREGWLPVGDPFAEPAWGLTFVEYRYRLRDRG